MRELPSHFGFTDPSRLRERTFEELAREGMFLMLENYAVDTRWTRQQVARDLWQNFFDAGGYTTDGITVNVRENAEMTRVKIEGASSFPFNRLFALGAGYKEDKSRSAGGKHEGAKLLALTLLRDYGCREVRFGSADWIVRYYLDEPPAGMVDAQMASQRALYAQLISADEPIEGSYVTFLTEDRAVGEETVRARELFYSKDNADFQHPDIDTDRGGLRMLGPGKKGNFYLNGQRISVDRKDEWQTVPGFTLWSKTTPEHNGKKMTVGRDRDFVSTYEVQDTFVPFLIESVSSDDLEAFLRTLEPYYREETFPGIEQAILSHVVRRLAKEGKKMSFPSNFLAVDMAMGASDSDRRLRKERIATFEALGYVACPAFMKDVGMAAFSDVERSLLDIERVEPSPEEAARIAIMEGLVQEFLKDKTADPRGSAALVGHSDIRSGTRTFSDISFRPVVLFGSRHPYLAGKYVDGSTWISRDQIRQSDMHDAMATYLHELCHEFGSDESAQFSYALTSVLARWSRFAARHSDRLRVAEQGWNEVKMAPLGWKSLREARADVGRLFEECRNRTASLRVDSIRSFTWEEIWEQVDRTKDQFVDRSERVTVSFLSELHDRMRNHPLQKALDSDHEDRAPADPRAIDLLRNECKRMDAEWEQRWRHKTRPNKMKPKDREFEADLLSKKARLAEMVSRSTGDRTFSIVRDMRHANVDGLRDSADILMLNNPVNFAVFVVEMLFEQTLGDSERAEAAALLASLRAETVSGKLTVPLADALFERVMIDELSILLDRFRFHATQEQLAFLRMVYDAVA